MYNPNKTKKMTLHNFLKDEAQMEGPTGSSHILLHAMFIEQCGKLRRLLETSLVAGYWDLSDVRDRKLSLSLGTK